MEDVFSLKGKTILITGATSGIGRACAVDFAANGARIIAVGRNQVKLDNLKAEIGENGHVFRPVNFSAFDSYKFISDIPAVDGAFLCAGIASDGMPLKFITDDLISEIVQVNLVANILMTREMIKYRKINRGGSLVYTASISGVIGNAKSSIYATTKAGLIAFSKYAAVELAPRKCRVNAISPGVVETPMVEDFIKNEPELCALDTKKYLLGYGKTGDIVSLVRFLMSDASSWITGTNIVVDGGYSCQK